MATKRVSHLRVTDVFTLPDASVVLKTQAGRLYRIRRETDRYSSVVLLPATEFVESDRETHRATAHEVATERLPLAF